MTRAERRQELRKAGQRRSPSKKGRRSHIRAPRPEPETFPTLEAKGFAIAKPRLHLPGEKS